MKTFVRNAAMLWAVAAMFHVGIAQAEDIGWLANGNQQPITLVGNQETAQPTSSCLGCEASCGEESCGPSCANRLGREACPDRAIVGFAGFDSFKGVSDGSFESNFGAVTGLNGAMMLPVVEDYGIGWQLGMSYGVYDFDGWGSNDVSRVSSQQQTFLTTGFYHKANEGRRLSYGLVYDWMFNDNWGIYGISPTLSQWRGQVEYSFSGCNALGVWACASDHYSVQRADGRSIRNAAVNQANIFWHHKFNMGADSWLWIGVPERYSLTHVGSLGDWMVGANVQVPLSDRLALYANGSYFHPTAAGGPDAAMSSGYDVSMGVAWYFGGHAVSHSINGASGVPYMPMGNNSNFLVDQSHTF
jgi:hypothetical protein